MSTLILELRDEQIQELERLAQQRGTSINAVVVELINDLATHDDTRDDYDVTQDPIYNIKSHETGAPADLSQNADHYLYGTEKR